MASGNMIVRQAAGMSVADLSVLLTALTHSPDDTAVLVTSLASDNDRLWTLMAEKGWLCRGERTSNSGFVTAEYTVNREWRDHLLVVTSICFEGRRQDMSVDEIMASSGNGDPRLRQVYRRLDVLRGDS